MRRIGWILGLAVALGVLAMIVGTARLPEEATDDRAERNAGPAEPATADGDDPGSAAGAVVLTGRVLRESTREAVTGAEVSLERDGEVVAETTSGPEGRFRLRLGEPADGVTLRARAEGLTTLHAIPPRAEHRAAVDVGDLVLMDGWTLHGTVLGENGERVAGARIRFEPQAPEPESARFAGTWREVGVRTTATSDGEGRFRIDGVTRREFRIEVVAAGHVTARFGGIVRADGERIELRLRRGQSVRVRVEDEHGRPVVGARVSLHPGYRITFAGHYKTMLRLDRIATTDADGRCRLDGLAERNYHVFADVPGVGAGDATLFAGRSEVSIRLRPGWRSSRFEYARDSEPDPAPPGSRSYPWTHEPSQPRLPDLNDTVPEPEPAKLEVPDPPPDRGRVRIRVLSAEGLPVPDVRVALTSATESDGDITEADGAVTLTAPPGRYRMSADPVRFGSPEGNVIRELDVPAGVVTRLDLKMPRVHAVRVEVRDVEGRLMPRARISVYRGEETVSMRTGPDGRILLFGGRDTPFWLLARMEGMPAAHVGVAVGMDESVVLRMPPRDEIRGRVLDPSGSPLFGARVVAEREGISKLGEEAWRTWTDAGGRFELPGPAAALYHVGAFHPAYGRVVTLVDVAKVAGPVTLRLRPLDRLRGRLTDREGVGVPGALIEVLPEGARVASGEDGRFEIVLPASENRIGVRHEEYLPVVVPVSGTTDDLAIRLSRGVDLTLDVRHPEGLRFEVAFTDVTGEPVPRGRALREGLDGGTRLRYHHAPEGVVRVRVEPRKGEVKTIEYTGREGESVELQVTLP